MGLAEVTAGVVMLGVALLATWYHRVHLGNPPSWLSWSWPGLATAGLVILAVIEPTRTNVGLVIVGAGITAAELYLYRRHRSRDRESEGGAPGRD